MTESRSPAPRELDILRALVLVVAYAAWNATSDVIYEALQLDASPRADPLRLALILVGTVVTCGGVAWWGCVVWARRSLTSLGWRAPQPTRLVLLGLLLTGILLAGVFGFVAGWAGRQQVQALAVSVLSMPGSERAFFIIMGAKVAFAEETLFRGLLLSSLAQSIGPLGAVLLSSVVFGVYHRSLVPVPLLLMKMALGAWLATFTLASRSLVPAWIAHWLLWAIAGDN